MATLATPFTWAQRSDKLFITVNLRDIKDEKLTLTETSLSFDCNSCGKAYSATLNFFDEVDQESSKMTILGLGARLVIFKKNTEAEYWPRITKEGGKHNHITVDWEKYIDADEENDDGQKGLGQDWDPSQMQGFGGMGGMPGMGGMGGMPGMGGMGMPGMGGMGMPGMGGFGGEEDSDDDEEGAGVEGLEDEEEIPSGDEPKAE